MPSDAAFVLLRSPRFYSITVLSGTVLFLTTVSLNDEQNSFFSKKNFKFFAKLNKAHLKKNSVFHSFIHFLLVLEFAETKIEKKNLANKEIS